MEAHDGAGCAGGRATTCACPRDPERVLEAAIDAVRSDPQRWEARLESARGKDPTKS
jgi:hypothetical protein